MIPAGGDTSQRDGWLVAGAANSCRRSVKSRMPTPLVLIVDDDRAIVETFAAILADEGYAVRQSVGTRDLAGC
jgi:PleD family two-component response regulator